MHDMHEVQLRYNPNIHNVMEVRCLEMRACGHANRESAREMPMMWKCDTECKMTMCLEMRAHGHANRGNADIEMECLEIRAHGHANRGYTDMKMTCLEIRAHGHANRGNTDSNVNGMELTNGLIPT